MACVRRNYPARATVGKLLSFPARRGACDDGTNGRRYRRDSRHGRRGKRHDLLQVVPLVIFGVAGAVHLMKRESGRVGGRDTPVLSKQTL